MSYSPSLRDRIFWIIKMSPEAPVRTEIRDFLNLPNNVVTPAIKELIDRGMVIEGVTRLSRTTNKLGKTLYVSEEWFETSDLQNKIFD